jgi:hypothetical protein
LCHNEVPETPAEKRAREAQERADAKHAARVAAVQTKAAESALGKLEPVLAGLRALMSKERFQLLSTLIVEPLSLALDKLSQWHDTASNIVSAGSGELPFDVKSLAVEIGSVRKNIALATSMLGQLSRMG